MKINPITSTQTFKSLFRVPTNSIKGIKLETLGYERPQAGCMASKYTYFACPNEKDEEVKAEIIAKTGLPENQIESKKLDSNLNDPKCPLSMSQLNMSNLEVMWLCSLGAKEVTIDAFRG